MKKSCPLHGSFTNRTTASPADFNDGMRANRVRIPDKYRSTANDLQPFTSRGVSLIVHTAPSCSHCQTTDVLRRDGGPTRIFLFVQFNSWFIALRIWLQFRSNKQRGAQGLHSPLADGTTGRLSTPVRDVEGTFPNGRKASTVGNRREAGRGLVCVCSFVCLDGITCSTFPNLESPHLSTRGGRTWFEQLQTLR